MSSTNLGDGGVNATTPKNGIHALVGASVRMSVHVAVRKSAHEATNTT